MSSKIWQWHRGDGGAAAGAFDRSRPASRSRSLHVAKACFAWDQASSGMFPLEPVALAEKK